MIARKFGLAESRIHRDLSLLFSRESLDVLCPGEGLPVPRVTMGAPSVDPGPHAVFTLSVADKYTSTGSASQTAEIAFTVLVILQAASSDRTEALARLNRYIDVATQVALCDVMLGGAVDGVSAPTVEDSTEWVVDGRWFVGARIGYPCWTHVAAASDAQAIINQGG